MRELSQEEALEMMCAPNAADEPEESDFVAEGAVDEKVEEMFVKRWMEKEMAR